MCDGFSIYWYDIKVTMISARRGHKRSTTRLFNMIILRVIIVIAIAGVWTA
jgi:hypothetical protein